MSLEQKLIFSYLVISLIPAGALAALIYLFIGRYAQLTEYGVLFVIVTVSALVIGSIYLISQWILDILAIREYEHLVQIEHAKTEFVSVASHQLRTPLATINWYTEMLRSGEGGTLTMAQQSFVEEIYSSNKRMLELVDLLLDASRLEMGKLKITLGVIQIESILDTVLSDSAALITQKNLIIHRNGAQSIQPIVTDAHLLQIIFQNLISNAAKYTPDNGIITIGVESVAPHTVIENRIFDQDSIHITIADTGYGIPVDSQNHIFEKLFRADNAQKLDADGTGLGLYIVKMIVEQLSGTVWFNSHPDHGTVFHVVLPTNVSGTTSA